MCERVVTTLPLQAGIGRLLIRTGSKLSLCLTRLTEKSRTILCVQPLLGAIAVSRPGGILAALIPWPCRRARHWFTVGSWAILRSRLWQPLKVRCVSTLPYLVTSSGLLESELVRLEAMMTRDSVKVTCRCNRLGLRIVVWHYRCRWLPWLTEASVGRASVSLLSGCWRMACGVVNRRLS